MCSTSEASSTTEVPFIVGASSALDRAIRCGNEVRESVYEDRGILFI